MRPATERAAESAVRGGSSRLGVEFCDTDSRADRTLRPGRAGRRRWQGVLRRADADGRLSTMFRNRILPNKVAGAALPLPDAGRRPVLTTPHRASAHRVLGADPSGLHGSTSGSRHEVTKSSMRRERSVTAERTVALRSSSTRMGSCWRWCVTGERGNRRVDQSREAHGRLEQCLCVEPASAARHRAPYHVCITKWGIAPKRR
jgi:hypothetical protein